MLGETIIHCPYCHGYEYSNEKTGILANGDMGFELSKLISNWTKELTLFTNGKSTLTLEQTEKITKQKIKVIETEIEQFAHAQGQIKNVIFKDGTDVTLKAMYARPLFEQHCNLPNEIGVEFTEHHHIKVDMFQKTTVSGIYACGDNTSMMRSVANAVGTGSIAGVVANRELIEEEFK